MGRGSPAFCFGSTDLLSLESSASDSTADALLTESSIFVVQHGLPLPPITFQGIGYYSLSEAALGAILQTTIPGFRIRYGETFQIPLGQGRCIDFRIEGVLVEYHQLRTNPTRGRRGDFKCRGDYRRYRRALKQAGRNRYRRRQIIQETYQQISDHYLDRRKSLLEQHPELSGAELIVATTREEFYEKVILRFSLHKPPSWEEFVRTFWWLVNLIAIRNGRKPISSLE